MYSILLMPILQLLSLVDQVVLSVHISVHVENNDEQLQDHNTYRHKNNCHDDYSRWPKKFSAATLPTKCVLLFKLLIINACMPARNNEA